MWILSLFEFPARVYLPTQLFISQLRNIYCLALGPDSSGMVLPFIAQLMEQGGCGLVMPHTSLYWQNALAFVSHLTGNVCLPAVVVVTFEWWCAVVGFVPRLQFLFLLQAGRVLWAGMPFLALGAKAFSKARQALSVIMSKEFSVESIPLWHNALFVDESHYTYFSPALVRQGVLYATQVLR